MDVDEQEQEEEYDDQEDAEAFEAADEELDEDDQQDVESKESDEPAEVGAGWGGEGTAQQQLSGVLEHPPLAPPTPRHTPATIFLLLLLHTHPCEHQHATG